MTQKKNKRLVQDNQITSAGKELLDTETVDLHVLLDSQPLMSQNTFQPFVSERHTVMFVLFRLQNVGNPYL